jgi:hypothetical protein
VALLLSAACNRGPGSVHVVSVRVADTALAPALRDAGLDAAALEAAARSALGGAGFRLGDGARPHRALLDVASARLVPVGAVGPRVEVSVEIALGAAEAGKGPPRRESATADAALADSPSRREAWLAALGEASRQAAEALALSLAEDEKATPQVLADLAVTDPRVRDQAIRVAGERHLREAVPTLIARLPEEPPRLAHRIVGALAQIGDERAVPALIELARGSDPVLTTRIVRYVGDIGGSEAEGFLLTLASGHPDPRIRRAAREALEDLAARAKAAPVAAKH